MNYTHTAQIKTLDLTSFNTHTLKQFIEVNLKYPSKYTDINYELTHLSFILLDLPGNHNNLQLYSALKNWYILREFKPSPS